MIDKESYYCSNQLFDIEVTCNKTKDTSGFHMYLGYLSSIVVRNYNFISFSSHIPYLVVGYVKSDPRDACQNDEVFWFQLMVMLDPHYFSLSSRINDIITIKILSQGIIHAYFKHVSHLVC